MLRLTLLCLFGLAYSQVSAELGTEAIIGGGYARKGDFKYVVAIRFGDEELCGGTIIADQFILTAAHCVSHLNGQINIEKYTVIAGTHDLKHTHDAFVIPVETVYTPRHFVPRTYLHDIAVLKLKHKLNLVAPSHKIEKANLPKPDANIDNVCGVVTGFGDDEIELRRNDHGKMVEYEGKSSDKLKFANVRIIPNHKCTETNPGKIIYPSFICGQVDQRNHHHHPYEGVCSGDSGAPLIYAGEVIGVLSSSPFGCNETTKAGVYQRVSSYVHMIHNIVNGKPDVNVQSANVPH